LVSSEVENEFMNMERTLPLCLRKLTIWLQAPVCCQCACLRTCARALKEAVGDLAFKYIERPREYPCTHTHTHTHTRARARARALKEKVDLAMKSIKVSELQPLLERICP
jgi:hypothetical protein